jgi:hypothetical protein
LLKKLDKEFRTYIEQFRVETTWHAGGSESGFHES